MKVFIGCVNYNTYESLYDYLLSLEKSIMSCSMNLELTVLVVDNSSDKKTFEYSPSHGNIKICCVPIEENLGYINSLTYILKRQKIVLQSYDFFIISNVDIVVHDSFFNNLAFLQLEKEIGFIAPAIISLTDQHDFNPKIVSRPSLKRMKNLIMMYKFPVLYNLYVSLFHKLRKAKRLKFKNPYIYAGHGAFMIFTKEFILRNPCFDFPSYMYGEEIYFGELVRNAKLKTKYVPELCVYDKGHASTRLIHNQTIYKWNYDSLMILKDLFFYE